MAGASCLQSEGPALSRSRLRAARSSGARSTPNRPLLTRRPRAQKQIWVSNRLGPKSSGLRTYLCRCQRLRLWFFCSGSATSRFPAPNRAIINTHTHTPIPETHTVMPEVRFYLIPDLAPDAYVDPVEVDTPVGSCSRWDEAIAVLAGRRHGRLGGCQVTDHFCDFLHVFKTRRGMKWL